MLRNIYKRSSNRYYPVQAPIAGTRGFAKTYKNFVNGEWVSSSADKKIAIYDPTDNSSIIGEVPQTTKAEFDAIVANAKETFNEWKEVPIPQRVRYMLKYQELLK